MASSHSSFNYASTSQSGVNYGAQVGINYGTANFHLPPERPETPPSPLTTVPFPRDPDFVNRDTLLDQIRDKSLVLGSRIALVGLGGVGKSQLAIEYSYQVRSQAPAIWAFWVHASNATRFEQSFQDIADQAKIPGRKDPQANIFNLVENWLRDEKRGRWVLILDNVDDDEFLHKSSATAQGNAKNSLMNASTKPLLSYLPRSLNGFIIITSRTREVALKMVDYKDLIEFKPMERSEALELFERKLEQRETQESRLLVEELEFMPLAIVQAASYIRTRAPRCSVSQYLRDFKKNDREAGKLLKTEAGHIYRDSEAKNSILVTWQISFDHIRQKKPSAADLLSLMSFFDRQGIPEELLRAQHEKNHVLRPELSNDSSDDEGLFGSEVLDNFEDDITTLRDFSFISVSKDSVFFTMHRLVQLTTRIWLEKHGQTERWKERFISTLYYKLPTGDYKDWEICRRLFPHVKAAMSQRPESQKSLREWATLLYNGAWYAWQNGFLADTKDMALESRKQRVRLLGEEHKYALDSTAMLARAWSLAGHWEKAERLEVQVMKIRQMKFGEDHPSTITDMSNLALTYYKQGRWGEAEELQVQVMNVHKTKLGDDHPHTLSSMANLASTYCSQSRWEEAEQLQVQVIETRKTKLGEDHPDTLTDISNLALTCCSQGRWGKAEELQVQVMDVQKTKLGDDHPSTLTNISNLASTYYEQGRWGDAEELQVQVMEKSKTKLGDEHPLTLNIMANLALMFLVQGRREEAEQLQVQVMETRKTKLGEDHPDTLNSMASLAFIWKHSGQDAEAINLLRYCLAKQKQTLGLNHWQTVANSAALEDW